MAAQFTPATFRFLRGLIRNNDRDWFEARRPVYERALKEPLLAVIEEINQALQAFAPEHVRPPHKCMMRLYRDTRFSQDKRPYKRHLAAWWALRGMEKTSGGGFYLQIGVDQVLVAAGVYMPEREQMLAIRRWIAGNHETYRKLLGTAGKLPRRRSGAAVQATAPLAAIDPQALSRMPRGFPADHPAGELLRARNWGLHARLPSDSALDPGFANVVADLFRRADPVVSALNAAIVSGGGNSSAAPRADARKPLF